MKTKKNYKKLVGIILFVSTTWFTAFAQNPPLNLDLFGKQIVAQSDPTLLVNGNLYLNVAAGVGDSVVWNIWNGKTVLGNNLLAKSDMDGYVLLKHDGIWTYNFFSFRGIGNGALNLNGVFYENALVPIYSSNEVDYFWSTSGGGGTVAFSRFYLNPTTGNYNLKIILPKTNDTLSYNYFIYNSSDTSNAIRMTDIISHSGLQLSISNLYQPDSIIWMFNSFANPSAVIESYQPNVQITSDGLISAYVRQNGQWYKQKEIFRGISFDSTVTGELLAPFIPNATYTWYKNDQMLSGEISSSYIPIAVGTYKVIIVFSSNMNARLEQQTKIATFEYKVNKIYLVSGLADNTISLDVFTLYPNPANGFVNIVTLGDFEYKIENTNASTIISGNAKNVLQLDINNLNAGLYYVYVKSGNKQSIKKLVIR
jgi:hypothetical protein